MGGRPPVISDEEFVEYVSSAPVPHVRSTAEVADHFDMSPQGAIARLKDLQDDGRLGGKNLNKVWIWYDPDNFETDD